MLSIFYCTLTLGVIVKDVYKAKKILMYFY